MRFSLIFQICRVQTLIFSIDIYMYGIKCKKLLLMLYVHWIRVVSFSCLPCRNSACAHIHSSYIGCFFCSVWNTIYRVMKYSWYSKKWQYMCDMFSYEKVMFQIKITWRSVMVSFKEASPCPLDHVYEILIFLVENHNSGPIDHNTEQGPVEAGDTHI